MHLVALKFLSSHIPYLLKPMQQYKHVCMMYWVSLCASNHIETSYIAT